VKVEQACSVLLPAACADMRCGVWLSRLATFFSVAATAPLQNVISTFLEDLTRLQQWRSVALVHCSGE
jgi:hypothetical protein